LAAAAVAALACAVLTACFQTPAGRSKKQLHGTFQTRTHLRREVLEVPLPEDELEPPPTEQLPQRRVPYTMHVLSQYPDHHHLPEEGATQKFIQDKIQGALENTESLIKHVEVRVLVLEHFHKVKVNHKKPPKVQAAELVEASSKDAGKLTVDGYRALAPYQMKVIISLKNSKEVVFANPEKHAQATITEAVDEACDGIRRLMREEKVKEIQKQRRYHEDLAIEQNELDESDGELLATFDEEAMLADAAMDEVYRKIESAIKGAGPEAADAEAADAEAEDPQSPPTPLAQGGGEQSLRDLLL
jgi:hypothetical protein